MKKNYTTAVAMLLISLACSAQKEFNTWVFGNGSGLDFNSGSPQVISTGINGWDNSASISDTSGNLLFYCDGMKVQDKNGAVMPNGSGLLGDTTGGQAATIVKQPGSDNIYYVFTIDMFGGSLYYNIVDMSLNAGLGDVTVKNKVLIAQSTEKLVPVLHGDNYFIWIVAHELGNNNFRSYLVTDQGLDTTAVVSSVGASHSGSNNSAIGQLTVTKDGSKLACALYEAGQIQLFNFNRNLGIVSNPITLSGYNTVIGLEFSPDGSKLYSTQLTASSVYQFNLSTYNQSAIAASATSVGTMPNNWGPYYGGYMMLGPDDKIYAVPTFSSYVAAIANPNTAGNGCGFNATAINLSPKKIDAGLVNKIGVSQPPCIIQIINEIKVVPDNDSRFLIYPNPTSGFINVKYALNASFNVSIYTVDGKLVSEKQLQNSETSLNLNGLAKGVYMVKLFDLQLNQEITKRIIIQ